MKFDAQLSRDGSVDPVDKALYAALASFVDQGSREASDDPDEAPTRRVLAGCIGRSVDTVDRATKRLEERGLVDVERRQDPENPRRNIPSVYRLLDGERWDERAAERAERRRAERQRRSQGVAAPVRPGTRGGGRTSAARGGRTSAAVPLSPREEKESSPPPPPEPESTEATIEAETGREDESSTTTEIPLERAQALVDDAVLRWPSRFRAPGNRDRLRLSQRVADELSAGGDESVILDELTRNLSDVGEALSVMFTRTSTPGWGRSADPRPDSSRYTVTGPRPPWCGRCDERTRHVVVRAASGRESFDRCECHPEQRTQDAFGEPVPPLEELTADLERPVHTPRAAPGPRRLSERAAASAEQARRDLAELNGTND